MQATGNNSDTLIKSIRLQPDGLYFFDPGENGNKAFHRIVGLYQKSKEEIISIFDSLDCLNKDIQLIYCESDIYSAVPVPLFRREKATQILEFEHTALSENSSVQSWRIPALSIVVLFTLPAYLVQAVMHYFNHPILALFPYSYFRNETEYKMLVRVWMKGENADIIAFNNQDLVIFSHFDCRNEEDLLFHLTKIMDDHEMENSETSIEFFQQSGAKKFTLMNEHIPNPRFYLQNEFQ